MGSSRSVLLTVMVFALSAYAIPTAVSAAPVIYSGPEHPGFLLQEIAAPAVAKDAFAPFAKMRIGAGSFSHLSCEKSAHNGHAGAPFTCKADMKFKTRPYLVVSLKLEGRDGQLTDVSLFSVPWFFKSGSGPLAKIYRLDEAELQAYHIMGAAFITRFAHCESGEAKAGLANRLLSGWNLADILAQSQPYQFENSKIVQASCAFTEGWHEFYGVGPKDPHISDSIGLKIPPKQKETMNDPR